MKVEELESPLSKIIRLSRRYPLPFVALIGLAIGGIFAISVAEHGVAHYVWYATLIVCGLPVVIRTIIGMSRGKFAVDIIATLAIITAILTDEDLAGVIIVLMQTGGEAIEDYGLSRASSSLKELISRAPRIAMRKINSLVEEIAVNDVRVGDTLMVRGGDLVPVDGKVLEGSGEVDESAITGEPLPRLLAVGDRVMSGAISVGTTFEMRAESIGAESQYSKIVELVREAQAEKSPIQRLADRYAIWFTPITVIIAISAYLFTRSFDILLAVLVVATPCPLILATPVAVVSGINRAAKESIIVKSGSAMEQIGKGRVIVFDKTGTLTYGTPNFRSVVSFGGSGDEMLKMVASLEQLSSHPVAQAIATEGRNRFGELFEVSSFKETPGLGVEGNIDGKLVTVGSLKYVESEIGRAFGSGKDFIVDEAKKTGSNVSYVAINKEPSGGVLFSDLLRERVPKLIKDLKELGVQEVVMLTGDAKTNAEIIAGEAGIDHFEAELLPSQKVEAVKKLTSQFETSIMVGDGINDAPALATATVGVAMGAKGTGISSETATVVLLQDDVTKVSTGIAIGKRTLLIAKQSILFGMGGSIIMMIIASFGYILPAEGAIMQEILDVAVILNALRVRFGGKFL